MEIWQQIFSQKIGQMKPGDRWTLKADYNLQSNDLDPGWKQFLQQHAFARFQSSQQGQVKMKIFRQECKKCLVPKLEQPEFSQENVERVLENLMLKIRGKCYREAINPHDLSKIIVEAQTMGPHDSSHCDAAPGSTFFRPASLLPRIFPAQEEWREEETGSGCDWGSSCDWWRCCCYSCCLVIFLAVLIFVLLYFKTK
uniref:3CxxC-type domain-containing protein n=1 Tax=Gopherus evgoodei TaxID=1825980 RepID=A0A8C4YDT8_9SAUR